MPGGRRALGGVMSKERQELVLREWRLLLDRLRRFASARVADAGDALRAGELGVPADRAREDYAWALEAYEAAGKLLDEAADLPDLAAAVVLAERAVERLGMARARQKGLRAAAPVRRCFHNPLHTATPPDRPDRRPRRRRLSPRQASADRHPACDDCRRAILAGQLPDVLPALVPVRVSWLRTVRVLVPYYTVPQQWSLWSANACGAYGDDAPGLVLRGEHRRRAAQAVR